MIEDIAPEVLAEEIGRSFPALARHLGEEGLVALAGAVTLTRLHAGEELVSQGSPVATLCLTWEGHFGLRLGDEKSAVELGSLPEHTILGEVAFVDGGPVTASVLAMSRYASALLLTGDAFEQLAATEPRAAVGLLRALSEVLAGRLRFATERFEEVAGVEESAPGILDRLRALFGLGGPAGAGRDA